MEQQEQVQPLQVQVLLLQHLVVELEQQHILQEVPLCIQLEELIVRTIQVQKIQAVQALLTQEMAVMQETQVQVEIILQLLQTIQD